eukprot:8487840-Karenia_brevis.AAC.1
MTQPGLEVARRLSSNGCPKRGAEHQLRRTGATVAHLRNCTAKECGETARGCLLELVPNSPPRGSVDRM